MSRPPCDCEACQLAAIRREIDGFYERLNEDVEPRPSLLQTIRNTIAGVVSALRKDRK